MKLSAAAYSAEVATPATKAGSYGVFNGRDKWINDGHTCEQA
jgi:hypothetical protein